MTNNTIATAGDSRYLWGILLLIASLRRNRMTEPVIVGVKDMTPDEEAVLTGLDGVRLHRLGNFRRSLTCAKPEIMLQAETDYVTWVDSDGFFTGNCSGLLCPEHPGEIHIRMRDAQEHPRAFRGFTCGEDGTRIPMPILNAWRKNIQGRAAPMIQRSCSACLLSVHRTARPFLIRWQEEMTLRLPVGNTGVTDRRVPYYHQLDESVLNSCLAFAPEAPRVSPCYRLDKDPAAMFVHFVGQPKPWEGWSPAAFRHFDGYVRTAAFAAETFRRLPGPLPCSLKAQNKWLCGLLRHPLHLYDKIRRKSRKWLH